MVDGQGQNPNRNKLNESRNFKGANIISDMCPGPQVLQPANEDQIAHSQRHKNR